MLPIRSIVVALDFSELSDRALDDAIELARKTSAELHLVHAFDLRIPFVTPYEVAVPDRMIEEARDCAARKLAKALQKVESAGLTGKTHLSEVPAASAIARIAEDVGADLIALGTHGHTGLKHVVLGSVAERTLRLAPCAVLVVKDRAAARAEKGSRPEPA